MLGSLSEFDGKPLDSTLRLGIEQSSWPAAEFAEAALQLVENTLRGKNGGLNPGLGLENGPSFLAAIKNSVARAQGQLCC